MIPSLNHSRLYNQAIVLAIFTIVYNIIEGVLSAYFGVKDETLTLFGFGMDSFVENIWAICITQMVVRIRANPNSDKSKFEVVALKITGWCFYALAVVLLVSAVISIIEGHQPTSTVAGIVIAGISILIMWALIISKKYLGRELNSSAMIADANCNKVCVYMSVLLLLSSGLYELFQIPYIDALGALGLIYFCITEGKEAFEKAKGIHACGCDDATH